MENNPREENAAMKGNHRTYLWVLFCVVTAIVGLVLRTQHLDVRPMHHDEANQAVRFGELLESGHYEYDPQEHHGPILYYFTVPVARLMGQDTLAEVNEWTLRLLPAVLGAATGLLTIGLAGAIGWPAVAAASAFVAVSPCLVYYSGYFIQESFLVFLGMLTLVCGWRYMSSHRPGWLVLAGTGLGFMHATKETWVLALAAWGLAWGVAWLLSGHRLRLPRRAWRSVVLSFMIAVMVSVVLFSSLGFHWQGVVDSWATYLTYLERGSGTGTEHGKPWYYYLRILVGNGPLRPLWWTELWILLSAAVGLMVAWGRDRRRAEAFGTWFVLAYALIIVTIYSVIRYKTPWCMMTSVHALCLAAGVGAGGLWRRFRPVWFRVVLTLLLAAACGHLYVQSVRATSRYSADTRNPYVYAHTTTDYLRMIQRIEDIAETSGVGHDITVWSVTGPHNAWPLPWYLRSYNQERIGFWTSFEGLPVPSRPDIWVVGPEHSEQLPPHLEEGYISEFYGLRPDVIMELYIRDDLWEKFLDTRR